MSSLGVGITAAVNAKCLFMLFLIICRQCLFSLPIYCNVCGILSQSVAVVHYEGALKRRVWLVSMCEATICVVRMCGSTMGLWGCVWLWIVCEDCGACEDNHSLPTNAFAMVSTQRANTVATNNNDNSHNAKYRCNKILNQTDFLKQIMLYRVRHEWWWSVNESIRTAGPCIILCPPWCLWPSQIAPSSPAARRRC